MKRTASISWKVLVLLSGLLLSTCEALWVGGPGRRDIGVTQQAGQLTGEFKTVWNIPASDLTLTLPLVDGGRYDFTVDWDANDDSSELLTVTNTSNLPITHTYTEAGKYTVTITGKTFVGWRFVDDPKSSSPNYGDAKKLVGISQWGGMGLDGGDIGGHFMGASNLKKFPTSDAPDLGATMSLRNTFYDASDFNGDISSWDVSSVENMQSMFNGATKFNSPLAWGNTVQNVKNMSFMFNDASSFDQDISEWNVSAVEDMSHMFDNASEFNSPLNWNEKVKNVKNMSSMFARAAEFNQDIGDWNVSAVEDMRGMFASAAKFNQDISSWDVSSVENMQSMFSGASAFNNGATVDDSNSPLAWGNAVQNVTNMSSMFASAAKFNQDISSWDVSMVTNMDFMFNGAKKFSQNISGWDVDQVEQYGGIFTGCPIARTYKPSRFR